MTLEGSIKSFFTKLHIWHVQLIGIYSRIILVLIRKAIDKSLRCCHASRNNEIGSSQLGSSLRGGTCGILVGTANSFWGKKHFVIVI